MKGQLKIIAAAGAMLALLLLVWRSVDRRPPERGEAQPARESAIAPLGAFTPKDEAVAGLDDAAGREPVATRDASATSTPSAPRPEETTALFGKVVDKSTNLAPASRVDLRLFDERWQETHAIIDGLGNYTASPLHPGAWRILARAQGYRTLRLELTLPSGEGDQRRDLLLSKADLLKVKLVAPDGSDVPWQEVTDLAHEVGIQLDFVATLEEPGDWLVQERKDVPIGVGRFKSREPRSEDVRRKSTLQGLGYASAADSDLVNLSPEYCGVFELAEPLPVWVAVVVCGRVQEKQIARAGAQEVLLELDVKKLARLVGGVRLRVLDGLGNAPPPLASVALEGPGGREERRRVRGNGTVTFDRVPAGQSVLQITCASRESLIERIVVEPNRVNDLGTYRMQEFAEILGRIVDEEDKPVSTHVAVFPMGRYEATRITLADRLFQSNQLGELAIHGIGRGRYLVRVCSENVVADPIEVDTSSGLVDKFQIRVSRATPVVLRFLARPPADARVRIHSNQGLPVLERSFWTIDPVRVALAPGNYSVQIDAGETWLATQGMLVARDPLEFVLGH